MSMTQIYERMQQVGQRYNLNEQGRQAAVVVIQKTVKKWFKTYENF